MRIGSCTLNGRTGHDAGRELLRLLYRMQTDEPLPEIAIANAGRPYFPNSPYYFSISHTKKHAFCVLSHCNAAIDAEEIDRPVSPRLMERVLSEAERQRCLAASDPRIAFLKLWVLKEAAAKLSGEGLRGFPNHTDFSPGDPRVWVQDGCIVALLREDPTEGVSFHAF